jgi:hypothetical protein
MVYKYYMVHFAIYGKYKNHIIHQLYHIITILYLVLIPIFIYHIYITIFILPIFFILMVNMYNIKIGV